MISRTARCDCRRDIGVRSDIVIPKSARIGKRQWPVVNVAVSIEVLRIERIKDEWVCRCKPSDPWIVNTSIHVNELHVVEHVVIGETPLSCRGENIGLDGERRCASPVCAAACAERCVTGVGWCADTPCRVVDVAAQVIGTQVVSKICSASCAFDDDALVADGNLVSVVDYATTVDFLQQISDVSDRGAATAVPRTTYCAMG